jgi:hypothetical protein
MFDTLLPIPDAEYPAFYPIGIKASCVCDLNNRKMEQAIDILKKPILALYINV